MARLRRASPYGSARSETFSDGVFAVAITLLALDLMHIHATEHETLLDALTEFWPVLLAFAASFVFIAVAWTNHHNVFVKVERMSRNLNAANLALLAGVVMVPWATSTLAEALSLPGKHGQQEVLLYSAVLIFEALAWFWLFTVLAGHPELLADPENARGFATDRFSALIGVAAGVVAGVVGWFWSPIAAPSSSLRCPSSSPSSPKVSSTRCAPPTLRRSRRQSPGIAGSHPCRPRGGPRRQLKSGSGQVGQSGFGFGS